MMPRTPSRNAADSGALFVEPSSALDSDPVFLRRLLADRGVKPTETQFQRIVHRARQAVATSYRQHYLTVAEFEEISMGVMLGEDGDV